MVQLRQDNKLGTLFNMVGFQTKLKHGEQVRILRTIPGLANAEFARLGGLHRNTFLNSPKLLDGTLRLKTMPRLRFAGQITGCEGYVESAAIGLLAGRFAAAERRGEEQPMPPPTTAHGALLAHITGGHMEAPSSGHRSFQPMNVNFGLFPPPPSGTRSAARKQALAERALADLAQWSGAARSPCRRIINSAAFTGQFVPGCAPRARSAIAAATAECRLAQTAGFCPDGPVKARPALTEAKPGWPAGGSCAISSRALCSWRRAKAPQFAKRRVETGRRTAGGKVMETYAVTGQEGCRQIKLPPRNVKRERPQQTSHCVSHARRGADRVRFDAGEDLHGERKQRRGGLLRVGFEFGQFTHRLVIEIETVRLDQADEPRRRQPVARR